MSNFDQTSPNEQVIKVKQDCHLEFLRACRVGHLPMVELMISNGANNWSAGFINACRVGHLQIVELMISHGANEWETGFYIA